MAASAGIYDPLARTTSAEIEHDFARVFGQAKVAHIFRAPGLLMMEADPAGWQRLWRSPGGNVIAWDGRVDNAGDFQVPADLAGAYASDAAIFLGAYEHQGEAALGKAIGDWRAAIWDSNRGALILANDFTGVRPLYYSVSGGRIIWSSSLAALAAMIGAKGELDELYAADFLLKGGSRDRTPYTGILALPPGYALSFSVNGSTLKKLWSIPVDELLLKNEDEYSDRLQFLFEQAVKARLRGPAPAHIELSGGLDSSSVIAMAHRLIAERRVEPYRIIAVNYREKGSVDEKFVDTVEQQLGIDCLRIDTGEFPFVSAEAPGGPAPAFWQDRDADIRRLMRDAGSHTLLTGRLGDLIMGNFFDDSEQVAEPLRNFALHRACSEAMAWSRVLKTPVYSILFRALKAKKADLMSDAILMQETSLTAGVLQNARDARQRFADGEWKHLPPARGKRFQMLREALENRALMTPAVFEGLVWTHPYAHRPLVEYMFSVPPRIVCGPGEPRRLMRRALGNLLPAAVLSRRSKASFDGVFYKALRPLARELLKAQRPPILAELGIVDDRSLRSRLERFLAGIECGHAQLRQIILLEFWLRRQRP